MKSRAQLKSHPLHPILVNFPIAFFTGTLIFDALALVTSSTEFLITASWLNIAGIIGALCAAIPGFIDFLYAVPPHSSAKKRAAKHGITNVTVLLLFVVAYCLRDNETPRTIILVIEFVAAVLLGIAGWMGGTLVYRNQIGVDIRYAQAGKWKEIELDEKNSVIVNEVTGLKENQMILLRARDRRLVLTKIGDSFVAFDDRCTHRGGSLAGGSMICGTVQCPWHGSHFDVTTGNVKAGPAATSIKTYEVKISEGRLMIVI